jgi:SAM-dependent MidA family methyltransferase
MMPRLSPEEEAHSRAVTALIRQRVREAGGWISFEQFMELALYAPGLGYYSAGSVKLGPGGDFVTAPEVSDLFGRCVARQCAQVLAGGGEILELGAGLGSLAAVILEALAAAGAVPERYAILEVSADLAERQRARLANLPRELRERVIWLERLPARPIRGVILANEVLDALPCRRFILSAGEVRELGVALDDDHGDHGDHGDRAHGDDRDSRRPDAAAPDGEPLLIEREALPDEALRSACSRLRAELPQSLPDGYSSELCLRVSPWIAGIGACLGRGAILLLDYGLPRSHYYHRQRMSGTLRCHFKQRAHDDPYLNIGVQDITAWVDFTRVAEAAVDAGLEVSGFATQAAFLLALGIEKDVAAATDPLTHARLAGEARRLLLPGEMGEAFKVMALARGLGGPLRGFSLQDLRGSL